MPRPHLPLESHPASWLHSASRATTSAAEARIRRLENLARTCLSVSGIRQRTSDLFAVETEYSLKSRRTLVRLHRS